MENNYYNTSYSSNFFLHKQVGSLARRDFSCSSLLGKFCILFSL